MRPVPRPHDWNAEEGVVLLTDGSRILLDATFAGVRVELPGPAHQTVRELAVRLRDDLARATGLSPRISDGTAKPDDIVLRLVDDARLGPEGYRLDTTGPVRIEAASTHGLFYGTRTLLHLLTGRSLPRGSTEDRPAQRVRMVMLDAARKYWQLDYLERLIRKMGELKLNTLFMHFSDAEGFRLNSPRFPGLAHEGSSYTRHDIDRLKRVAAEEHVQLMPGLDLPGHATVISDVFQIGFGDGPDPCTDEQTHEHLTPDWIVDITSPRAVDVTKQLVDEFAGWFDAPLFCVGADELPAQLADCERVRRRLAADPDLTTMGDLLNAYINTLDDVVTRHGKRTAIYNGSERMAAPQQRVHSSVVFLTWEGTGTEPVIPGHDEIAIGPFYVTPNNYHDLYPDAEWMYGTWIPSTAPDMLGSGLTNWADYNYWAEDAYFERHMALPRAILAERTWNGRPATGTLADFRERVTPIEVGGGEPAHHWTFDAGPYPQGWTYASRPPNTIFTEDLVGGLHGTSYIVHNPSALPDGGWRFGHDRDGVGFGGVDAAEPWTASVSVRLSGSTPDSVLLSSKEGALKLQQWRTGKVGFTRYGVADHSFDYALPLNRWVRLTWVAEPGRTTLYADGAEVGTVNASIKLPLRSVGTEKASFRGDLDDLKTWRVP